MLVKETVYFEVLESFFKEKKTIFTQKEIALKHQISIGLVNKTLKELEEIGAIERKPRNFQLIDAKKLSVYWATKRNLHKDIVYKTFFEGNVKEIEGLMPDKVVFTAYSGYRLLFDDTPADYNKVFVYGDSIRERFPKNFKQEPNVFLLKKPDFLKTKKISLSLLYVDLWNLKDWFAADYLKALEKRLFYE
ncbi:MAG: hypothetical protein ABH821_06290 [archaeon]